jgi:hypothetical protein
MRSIETTIEIDASPAEVWVVVTDTAAYPEWNPFIRSLEGELQVGARLRVRIEPPEGRGITLRPKIVALTPVSELRWLGRIGLPRIFDGEHRFAVEPIDGGRRTRFVHAERFRGVLVPLLGSLLRNTEAGFAAMNEALRQRVEVKKRVGCA